MSSMTQDRACCAQRIEPVAMQISSYMHNKTNVSRLLARQPPRIRYVVQLLHYNHGCRASEIQSIHRYQLIKVDRVFSDSPTSDKGSHWT